ncbi:MAG: hypothetical protein ABJA67_14165 [Chthonomonadales bacterium]
MVTMKLAHDLEDDKKWDAAIKQYGVALTQISTVDADLQTPAKIAIHNRMAAVYRKSGDNQSAMREF